MDYLDIIDTIKDLSNRDDLPNNLGIFFLNSVKIEFQQANPSLPLAEHSLAWTVAANKRSVLLPSDFLSWQESGLRRPTSTVTASVNNAVAQNTQKVQFIERVDSRSDFEMWYPLEDSSGTMITGIVEAYYPSGEEVLVGPVSNTNEVFQLDYYRKLPEYSDENPRDIFTEIAFNLLVFGGLELLYRTYVVNPSEADKWMILKIKAANDLLKQQTSLRASGSTINLPIPQTNASRRRSNDNRVSRSYGF